MTLDGFKIEPLPNGTAVISADGYTTHHADPEAAIRHIQRLCCERLRYEAMRIAQGGRP